MYCLHTSRTKPVQSQMRLNQALVFQTCTLYAFWSSKCNLFHSISHCFVKQLVHRINLVDIYSTFLSCKVSNAPNHSKNYLNAIMYSLLSFQKILAKMAEYFLEKNQEIIAVFAHLSTLDPLVKVGFPWKEGRHV